MIFQKNRKYLWTALVLGLCVLGGVWLFLREKTWWSVDVPKKDEPSLGEGKKDVASEEEEVAKKDLADATARPLTAADVLRLLRDVRRSSRDAAKLFDSTKSTAALFAQTLAAGDSVHEREKVAAEWAELAMVLEPVVVEGQPFWLLYEREDRREGRGFFIFRKGSGVAVSLQIPHGESDLLTDVIGVKLCVEQAFHSCAFNTVHRRQLDLAHVDDSYFQTLMEAEVSSTKASLVVQLHGFEQQKRKGKAAQLADFVLTNGTRQSDACVAAVAARLAKAVPNLAVKVYGKDVFDLGGTRNAQAARLRMLGGSGGNFLHVEISRGARELLRDERPLRQELYLAFLDGLNLAH